MHDAFLVLVGTQLQQLTLATEVRDDAQGSEVEVPPGSGQTASLPSTSPAGLGTAYVGSLCACLSKPTYTCRHRVIGSRCRGWREPV